MSSIQIIILAILQGITEFLPVSSSAHLILLPKILGWSDQGLAFDIAVHIGTLFAIIYYFRKELQLMILDWTKSISSGIATPNSRLAWMVIFGTIPVVMAGFFAKQLVATALRSEIIIAFTTIFFGLLLGMAYWQAKKNKDEYAMTWRDVLIIGVSQALALIPGTSRSGITTTAGLMVGLTSQGAARYSFLLAIPVIVAAGLLQTLELVHTSAPVAWRELLLAVIISASSGYCCIYAFLKLLNKIGFYPFVIYRLILGAFLFSQFL